jgi:hypothetical protein
MPVKVPPLLHKMSASAQKAWYKKHGMEMPAKEKSAATAGKMKAPEPKKAAAAASDKPKTAREISMERQKAYYAKGGRQPIGAGGSGGHSSMAGVGQSSAKEIIKGIRAGVNPKSRGIGEEVSLEEGKMKDIATGRQETERLKAQDVLGGKVKTRTGNEPKGKLPLGFRSARNLARKAMKAGTTVTESTTEVNNMSYGKKLAKSIMAKQSKHPIAQQMGEAVKDAADVGEYDYEGDMAKSQLRSILTHAKRLHDMLDDQTNLPEWVQSKITLAQDYVLTAADYMEGEMNEGYGGKFPKEWQKEMEKIPSTSTVVHKDKTVVTTKKDGKVVDVKTTKNEEVEQVSEKAPPGAKYERMVKHIKKGYAKGGLTPKEKSIAYATAWKSYKKNEEVEQVEEKYENNPLVPPRPNKAVGLKPSQLAKKPAMAAEAAEGSTPTTPKEKSLAAHHGDKTKITYGDVIKARLKSAAAKKMGK